MIRTTAVSALALLGAGSAQADVPRVVADIPPVHSLAAQVLGDLGKAELLLETGGNAHDYQLRPSQARAVANADLVFWVGAEMTPWLDRTLDGIGGTAKAVALLDAEETYRREFGDNAAHHHDPDQGADHGEAEHHDHDDDHGHAGANDHDAHDHDAHDHDAHDHSGLDPHAWLDPANARAWLQVIAAELAAADPDNAARYAANAEAAAAQIAALDARTAKRLAPVADRPFVTFHQAYGYFAGHYGLTVAGSVALGDAAAPGAARLSDLRADLSAGDVVCAFPEAQHDPALVGTVVEGTSVRIGGVLDPSGSSLPPGPNFMPR